LYCCVQELIKNWTKYNEGVQHLSETIDLAESQLPEDPEHTSALTVEALEAVIADTAVSLERIQSGQRPVNRSNFDQ
jgi:hypothetical protein